MPITRKTLTIPFLEYDTLDDLEKEDALLVAKATESLEHAYAPYSHFAVGAAVRTSEKNIVIGCNQENIASPSGCCAERVALFSAKAQLPTSSIEAIAIVARNKKGELSSPFPCGACRQVMKEIEQQSSTKMRVLILQESGSILCFQSVSDLIPFSFYMKK